MSGLTFVASSGINALLAIHGHARAKAVDVAVVAVQHLVLRPPAVTGARPGCWPFTRLCPTPWRHCVPASCTEPIRMPIRPREDDARFVLMSRCAGGPGDCGGVDRTVVADLRFRPGHKPSC
ncbi:hypothetical protein ACFV4N_32750 [Actinosynnema sp. NPDC059797]